MKRATWIRTLVVIGFVLLLEGLCRWGVIGRMTMIPPSEMADQLWKLLQSGRYNDHILETLGNVAVAFVSAVVGGFVIGSILHSLPRARRAIDPFLATYYAIPFFAFYPLLVVIFGLSAAPIILIGFLFGVVAMIINTMNGLDRIPRVLIKTARVNGLGPLRTAWLIKLPSAAPQLFTGIKLAIAYSFIGVIAAEFIMSTSGLGYSIAYAFNNFDNRTMYALMLFIITLVTIVNAFFHVWERRIMARRGQ